MTEQGPTPQSIDKSRQIGLIRKQAFELAALLESFLQNNPDVDLSGDDDLTPDQQIAWDVHSADVRAFHQSELQQNNP